MKTKTEEFLVQYSNIKVEELLMGYIKVRYCMVVKVYILYVLVEYFGNFLWIKDIYLFL